MSTQAIVAALPRLVTTSYVFDEVVTFFKLHRPVKKVDVMINIHKKIVVDEKGNPQEVIIPWDEFQEIAEILGIDLDPEALEDLRQARRDREAGRQEAYIDLDNL